MRSLATATGCPEGAAWPAGSLCAAEFPARRGERGTQVPGANPARVPGSAARRARQLTRRRRCVCDLRLTVSSTRRLRRRMRVRVLVAGVAAAARPLGGAAAPSRGTVAAAAARRASSARSTATQGKIGRKKGTERVLTTEIAAYTRRISAPAGPHLHPAATRPAHPGRPRPQARRARRASRRDLRSERARLVRLRARLAVARARCCRAAGRALQGRPARPRHGDPQLQGLRRPARARRVHPAHLRPGPQDRRTVRDAQGRRDGHRGTGWTALERRQQQRHRRSSSSAATRSPRSSRS